MKITMKTIIMTKYHVHQIDSISILGSTDSTLTTARQSAGSAESAVVGATTVRKPVSESAVVSSRRPELRRVRPRIRYNQYFTIFKAILKSLISNLLYLSKR